MTTAAKEMTDRQLDALVAERVMGLQRLESGGFTSRSGRMWLSAPRYSTDIASAMLVVEKMRRDHFRFDLNDRAVPTEEPWCAEFATLRFERSGQATASSPARAICLAALETVNSEREEKGGVNFADSHTP